MKPAKLLAAPLLLALFACQPTQPSLVTVIDGERVLQVETTQRTPAQILGEAGITLEPHDRILVNGLEHSTAQTIAPGATTLQVRRAVPVHVTTAGTPQELLTSAWTIGEVLQDASIWLREGDSLEPDVSAPLSAGINILHTPARELTVSMGGQQIRIESSAHTIGEALARAGLALTGLDYSVPLESEPLPPDGQIQVVRVSESVQLAQKPVPFESELQASADVPLDQTRILQPGEPGLSVQRIRIRYEDGQEISRIAEEETLVRPPQTRLMGYGTKIEVKSAMVDGVQIEYWRAVQMYATSYSPCRSGTDKCYPGTSSGKTLQKGMVGLRQSWYLAMQGQGLYIPGYGFASVEDVCGGCVGQPWIDLGYSDADFEPWSSWVTVYFLTPVPAHVIHVLQ